MGRPKGANRLSAAEKQRRYRARRDADPERRKRYLKKEQQKYREDMASGRKKTVNCISEREKSRRRKKWRETYYNIKSRREALKLVSKGTDIPDASELFPVLSKTDTTVKLEEDAVDRAVSDVPPVPSAMTTHRAATVGPGELSDRDVSCPCTAEHLSRECFNPDNFIFNQQKAEATTTTEHQWQGPEVVGKWCVLMFDGQQYPGIITDTDASNTHVLVRCMRRIRDPVCYPSSEESHSSLHGN